MISRFNALENNCLSLNKNHFVLLAAELLLLLLLTIRFTACVLCALLIDMKFDVDSRDRYSNFPSLIYISQSDSLTIYFDRYLMNSAEIGSVVSVGNPENNICL